jgi:hypothetical protein
MKWRNNEILMRTLRGSLQDKRTKLNHEFEKKLKHRSFNHGPIQNLGVEERKQTNGNSNEILSKAFRYV